MPQQRLKRYGRFLWVGGLAATALGVIAIASPARQVHDPDKSVIVTPYGEFTAAPETMEALDWFGDRGLCNGFRVNADSELTHMRIVLSAADGVELPTEDFEADFVRFNEAGEVVHIEFAPPNAPSCKLLWIHDTQDPQYWLPTCVGRCDATQAPCIQFMNFPTLELSCGCLH